MGQTSLKRLNSTLRLWDLRSGACLLTLQGHTGYVYGVACFSLPDGSPRAISAGNDRTLRVWDPLAGASLVTLEGHTSAVLGVACRYVCSDEMCLVRACAFARACACGCVRV